MPLVAPERAPGAPEGVLVELLVVLEAVPPAVVLGTCAGNDGVVLPRLGVVLPRLGT